MAVLKFKTQFSTYFPSHNQRNISTSCWSSHPFILNSMVLRRCPLFSFVQLISCLVPSTGVTAKVICVLLKVICVSSGLFGGGYHPNLEVIGGVRNSRQTAGCVVATEEALAFPGQLTCNGEVGSSGNRRRYIRFGSNIITAVNTILIVYIRLVQK